MSRLIITWFLMLAAVACGKDAGTVPGLQLTFSGTDGKRDVRSIGQVALQVPLGQPASPFLSLVPFHAHWEGFLRLESRSRLYFSFAGRGKAKLFINDELVLSCEGDDLAGQESGRLRLDSGNLPIQVQYDSPRSGESMLQLYWRGRDFAREIIPSGAFRRKPGSLGGDLLREGRTLFAGSSCIHCHEDAAAIGLGSMPELAQAAPLFAGIGSRLNTGWMAEWVANPRHIRSSARMPSLLGLKSAEDALAQKDTRPWDIAAWLSTMTLEPPKPLIDGGTDGVSKGRDLFHRLGCLGCHRAEPEPEQTQHFNRIDLSSVGSKFKQGALRDFLHQPRKHHAWSRMPDFGLTTVEATQLALFLRSLGEGGNGNTLPGNADKGKALALSLGCMNCHGAGENEHSRAPVLSAIVKVVDEGCLSKNPGNAPDFRFSDEQRAILKTFLQKGVYSLKSRNLSEFAERQVIDLNCNVCHPMHGNQNRLFHLPDLAPRVQVVAGDTEAEAAGRKKDPPDLTHVGEKLRVDWMKRLFAGKLNYKPRPWMMMRMPAFPARGENLALGLAMVHGHAESTPRPVLDESWTAIGRKLISQNGGFACVACHAVGNKPALAPFEGQGLNFLHARDRLNHGFYLRWMLNPQRVSSLSIMPRYADDEGQTALTDVLGGNANDQFNAIWQYLIKGDL